MRTKSHRSGLVFPVSRVLRYMRRSIIYRRRRINATAAVYTSAVMEYLTRELTELAGDVTIKSKRKLLTPRDIMLAMNTDEELHEGLKSVTLPFSGVVPRISPALYKRTKSSPRPSSPSNLSPRPKSVRSAPKPKPVKVTVKAKPKKQTGVSPIAVLSQLRVAKQTKLCVVRGSVTSVAGDVIIHPTGSSIGFNGQVGAALEKLGGQALRAIIQSNNSAPMKECEVSLTQAAGLPCPYLLHCNSPHYNGGDQLGSLDKLSRTIRNCLLKCEEKNLGVVVIPSVGSGNSGYPKDLAARTILREIKTHCDQYFDTTNLTDVYFVLYDQASIDVYTAELSRLNP